MNPQPYQTPPTHRPQPYDRCETCCHGWHGVQCVVIACDCESSWRDPEQVAS